MAYDILGAGPVASATSPFGLAGSATGTAFASVAGVLSGKGAAGVVSVGFASVVVGVASVVVVAGFSFFGNFLYHAPLRAPLSFSTASGAVPYMLTL